MKRILSLFGAILLILLIAIPTAASPTLRPSIMLYRYNGTSYEQLNSSELDSGDFLQVRIAFNETVPSLGSLRVRLEFPNNSVKFVSGSAKNELNPGDPQAGNPLTTTGDGYIQTYFSPADISANAEIATNVKSIVAYGFFCNAKSGTEISFKVTVDNLFDKDIKDIKMAKRTATANVKVKTWKLSAADEEAFKKLANFDLSTKTLAEIQADIANAEKIFNSYTSVDQANFRSVYPELYNYYETAWYRYYDLAKEASEREIIEAANQFKEKYAAVLALKSEDVNKDNYKSVIEAYTEINKLDGGVLRKLTDEKALLTKLNETAQKIKEQIKAQKDADEYLQIDFIEGCEALWKVTDEIAKVEYSQTLVLISQAEAAYNNLGPENLSDEGKALAAPYLEKLARLKEIATAAAKAAGENDAVFKEVSEFTNKWFAVIKLNSMTVGIKDETAINLMLEDFKNLSQNAQNKLSAQKNSAEQMLKVIASLKEISKDNNVTAPGGGSTVEVIKEVPVEVIKEVPVKTEVKVPTEAKSDQNAQAAKNTLSRETIIKEIPLIIKVVSIAMGISVLSMIVPIAWYLIKFKFKKTEK